MKLVHKTSKNSETIEPSDKSDSSDTTDYDDSKCLLWNCDWVVKTFLAQISCGAL